MPKKSAPAKSNKKTVSKKTTSKKHLNWPTLNTRNFILGLVVLLLFSMLGAFAGQAWQDSRLSAQAASYRWTDLTNVSTGAQGGGEPKSLVTYYSCKMSVTSNLQKIYVKAVKAKDGNSPVITLGVYQIGPDGTYYKGTSGATKSLWSRGTTMQLDVVATINPKEYVAVGYNDGYGGYSTSFDPAKVGNCTSR